MLRTLLIVDDIDTNRLILKKLLSGEYYIFEASNGDEALRIMRREYRTLSAVLLDLLMPGTDGYEVLRQAQKDDMLSQIPIIVTTGAAKEDSEVKALNLGCHDYISKPYNSIVIKQRLKNTINLRETAAAINALQKDALTGLYTRGMFFEKASELIFQQRPGYFMFACLDVDNFKVINDQYGTENGDMVLKHIAHCIDRYSYEMGGLCSRIAADNFALIYPNTPENLKKMEKCHRVAVNAEMIGQIINIRIGRYVIDNPRLPVSAMYDRAALAAESVRGMYGQYIALYSESMRDRLIEEQEIVFEMNNALRNRRFEVWFQPQFNHATGAVIGAEALARWRDPKKGMIPPSTFIPIFERNGFIYELDKFVWDGACRYLRGRLDAGEEPVRVSVNVSRVDALKPDFLHVITSIVENYNIPKRLLHLEITESAFTGQSQRLIAIVKRLIGIGFTIEIDDFGSGYSSLNTLKDVPATVLKLDMKFLDAAEGDAKRGCNIVQSVVRMAKWLGMSVIAEGVQTRAHADFLRSIGCNYVQGYLYSRPMTRELYEELSQNWVKQSETEEQESAENLGGSAVWDTPAVKIGESLLDSLRLIGTGSDITRFRAAFEHLKLVTDTIPGGIASYDVTKNGLRLTYFSEGYFVHTGYTKEEYMALANGDPVCLVFKEDIHVIADAVKRVFAGDDEFLYEYRAKRKGGGFCWLRIQGVIVERGGDLLKANVVKYDITDQKKTEELLRIKNEEMRIALCEMGKTVFLYDIPSRKIAVPRVYALSHGLDANAEYISRDELCSICAAEDDARAFKTFFDGIDTGEKRATAIIYMALPDGSTRLESAESITIFDDEGAPARAIISTEDITDRRREYEQITSEREIQARLAAEYKRLFTDASNEMYSHIIKIDIDTGETYKIEFAAGTVKQTKLNLSWDGYYKDFMSRTHPDDRQAVAEKTCGGDLSIAATKNGVKLIYRCVVEPFDGYRWYSTVMRSSSFESDLPSVAGERVKRYATAFTIDITSEMQERARLTDLSEHDALTDLYNRVKYYEMLESRYRTMDSCGVLFFDVNFMKYTNDTLGHEAGDALLRAVADGIRSITSRRIHAYRFGGDEFLLIACNATQREMDQLISMFNERLGVLFKNQAINGSVAVGKAFSQAPYSLESLINEADRDMYKNKLESKKTR